MRLRSVPYCACGAKTMIHGHTTATERRIDRLVYELYDLSDEEIVYLVARG